MSNPLRYSVLSGVSSAVVAFVSTALICGSLVALAKMARHAPPPELRHAPFADDWLSVNRFLVVVVVAATVALAHALGRLIFDAWRKAAPH